MDVFGWCRVSMWDLVLVFYKYHWPVRVWSGSHAFHSSILQPSIVLKMIKAYCSDVFYVHLKMHFYKQI